MRTKLLLLLTLSVPAFAQAPKLPDLKPPKPLLKVPLENVVAVDELEKQRDKIDLQVQPLLIKRAEIQQQIQQEVDKIFKQVGLSPEKNIIDEAAWTIVPLPEPLATQLHKKEERCASGDLPPCPEFKKKQ